MSDCVCVSVCRCGPCKMIAPEVEKLAASHPDVVFIKVDVEGLEEIAAKFHIEAMPTFKFMKKGHMLSEDLRGANKAKLIQLIEKNK